MRTPKKLYMVVSRKARVGTEGLRMMYCDPCADNPKQKDKK